MDHQSLPNELIRSISKHDKADLRREVSTGWGATTGGMALTKSCLERLTTCVSLALLDAHSGSKAEAGLVVILRGLSHETIALSILQTVLHSVGMREPFRDTLQSLGTNIANECWGAELTEHSPQIAARIARAAKLRHSSVSRRYEAVRAKVEAIQADVAKPKAKRRYKHTDNLETFKARLWSRKAIVIAGGFLWNIASAALPDVFERVLIPGTTEYQVTITEGAWAIVDEALNTSVNSNPVFWPDEHKPKAWTGWDSGGATDPRMDGYATVLRSYHKDTQAAVKHAIKTGQMQPTLDALNTLQSVPFTINGQVLDVLQTLVGLDIWVKGMPPKNLVMPPKLNAFVWDDMTEDQQGFYSRKRAEIAATNRGFIGDRVLFGEDMATAEAMAKHERFYTPMNCDWRGRVYALSHFNFQREDRVRALFNFSDGEPIGEDGLWWLKVHTANCGDFKVEVTKDGEPCSRKQTKISKRTLQERVQWCDNNTQLITSIASAPLVHTEWMKAAKPFLFLAACFELQAALEQGPSFITRLPISFDGSCSGLQHLSAMTRAAEGSMVNLTPSPLPQDVYQVVADQTLARVTADLTHQPENPLDPEELKASASIRAMAALFLEFGVDRDLSKRNVMTYSYSSKKFGMASQQQVDTMDPLGREVLEGKRTEHPFVGYQMGSKERPGKAARFIASHIFDAIETRIHKPAEAMKFLQSIAKALAHEGKPVNWTTPVGIPWINRYHEHEITRVELFLNDGGVRSSVRVNIATGSKKDIDKGKAANGVAPNFVHALDASHLLLVANAAALQGITSIATVHDSFGCLASRARDFNRIIREVFALMYETHDVLTQILERASCDLTDANRHRLPNAIVPGPLNLKDILNADFAFA
jgi:DNA-directed RNA polymerase, mitochondrial